MADKEKALDPPNEVAGETPKRKRATAIEHAQRVAFAADVLTVTPHKSRQIQLIQKEFKIKWRQAERYLTEARQLAVDATKMTAQEHLAEHIAILRTIMYDAGAGPRNRIFAEKQLSKLLGLRPDQNNQTPVKGRAEDLIKAIGDARAALGDWEPPALEVIGVEANGAANPG